MNTAIDKRLRFDCLYDCGSGAPSMQEYHVYPFSASTFKMTLEKGIVCDKCNDYFGRKLESHFVGFHPGATARVMHVDTTRKGKPPKLVHQNGELVRIDNPDSTTFKTELRNIAFKFNDSRDLRIECDFAPKPFDNLIVSRLLGKIVLESLCELAFHKDLNPFSERFDGLRQYVRKGPARGEFVWFAWRSKAIEQDKPKLMRVQSPDTGQHIGDLCEVTFPQIVYRFPLPPYVAPEQYGKQVSGYNIVTQPGLSEPPSIPITLYCQSQTKDNEANV